MIGGLNCEFTSKNYVGIISELVGALHGAVGQYTHYVYCTGWCVFLRGWVFCSRIVCVALLRCAAQIVGAWPSFVVINGYRNNVGVRLHSLQYKIRGFL
ncbi:MAG: hypothetical protein JWQ38_219 [Flavipsychrobacter sp.]|nr:hypothetical protein [Flavipsychrobacter sp.]